MPNGLLINQVVQGDCLEVLRTWPDNSVHCVVTSPPYWGLRDYGIEPNIWGGDPACEHKWGDQVRIDKRGLQVASSGGIAGPQREDARKSTRGALCQNCGAWRGSYGLEPTPDLFVEHTVAIFREVRRVLRDDGTLWLNLGSSYASATLNQSRSPLLWRGPACDNGGREPQDCRTAGRACLDSCDEHPNGISSHRDHTVHIGQCVSPDGQQPCTTAHDTGLQDYDEAPLPALPDGVLQSTMPVSSSLPSDASGLSSVASEHLSKGRTSTGNAQASAYTTACTSGTSPMLPPLVVRTRGKESFYSACHSPDCQGIGRCGLCWCNLAIPSLNVKAKDEINVPHLVALALQADGWILRQTIIWSKPGPMPESVRDRCTKSFEYLFLLTKSPRYYFDAEVIKEPAEYGRRDTQGAWRGAAYVNQRKAQDNSIGSGLANSVTGKHPEAGRNKRSVWTIATAPFREWQETYRLCRVALGEFSDGTLHIASPNCPVHGGWFDLVSMVSCGEHGDDSSIRIGRSIHLADVQPRDFVATLTPHVCYCGEHSVDWLIRQCFPIATGCSSESHRKAHDLLTNPACTPSAQRLSHIVRTLVERGLSEQVRNIYESNTWPGAMDARLLGQTIFRIVGKSSYPNLSKEESCCCGFYQMHTEKTRHFATFPPELVRPCIRAGTSAKGCCPQCGAPWKRVLAKDRVATRPGLASKVYVEPPVHPDSPIRQHHGTVCGNRDPGRHVTESRTIGWRPGCGHYEPEWSERCDVLVGILAAQSRCRNGRKRWRQDKANLWLGRAHRHADQYLMPMEHALFMATPCVILDPFGGSGTVGQVAAQEGRDYVLIEINPEYVAMAQEVRLTAVETGVPVRELRNGQRPLFPELRQSTMNDQPSTPI